MYSTCISLLNMNTMSKPDLPVKGKSQMFRRKFMKFYHDLFNKKKINFCQNFKIYFDTLPA